MNLVLRIAEQSLGITKYRNDKGILHSNSLFIRLNANDRVGGSKNEVVDITAKTLNKTVAILFESSSARVLSSIKSRKKRRKMKN